MTHLLSWGLRSSRTRRDSAQSTPKLCINRRTCSALGHRRGRRYDGSILDALSTSAAHLWGSGGLLFVQHLSSSIRRQEVPASLRGRHREPMPIMSMSIITVYSCERLHLSRLSSLSCVHALWSLRAPPRTRTACKISMDNAYLAMDLGDQEQDPQDIVALSVHAKRFFRLPPHQGHVLQGCPCVLPCRLC